MPVPTQSARLQQDLARLLERIPPGWVAAIGDVSRHLRAYQPHVVQLLAELGDAGDTEIPWWRVVADGGAIGRHARREVQMARLRAEGVPLSAAGIVQDMTARRVADLSRPPAEIPREGLQPSAAAAPSRSRGMKRHPQT